MGIQYINDDNNGDNAEDNHKHNGNDISNDNDNEILSSTTSTKEIIQVCMCLKNWLRDNK